ncbi:hypothetical protein [Pseudomonas putida]|uniref:hypothetical protein n=1 Tax=Pseudomonas putida TaxID=303 RepID=UPI000DFD5E39|nr:hypothetical protein [Pseudomonas putida]SUD77861.1 Uncharacterised protein [Pseudomonas putida]
MTIDKAKLKALAQAASQSRGARRVEVDHNGVHVIGDGSWKILSAWRTPDGKGAQSAEFAAAASPATILALLAEIEQLRESHEQVCTNYNRVSSTSEQRGKHIDQLKAENEVLRKQVADLSPFKNASPQDYRASNKCLACGDYHHGLGNLPCPRCTPVAQSAMAKEANHG